MRPFFFLSSVFHSVTINGAMTFFSPLLVVVVVVECCLLHCCSHAKRCFIYFILFFLLTLIFFYILIVASVTSRYKHESVMNPCCDVDSHFLFSFSKFMTTHRTLCFSSLFFLRVRSLFCYFSSALFKCASLITPLFFSFLILAPTE